MDSDARTAARPGKGSAARGLVLSISIALGFASLAAAEDGAQEEARKWPAQARPAAGDSPPATRHLEFEEAVQGALPFAEEAQRHGITVTDGEISERQEVYRKMYPNQPLDASRTKRLLLAEKYLEAKGIGGGESGGQGAKQPDPEKFSTPSEAEIARKAVRLADILGREKIRAAGRKLEDIAQIKRMSELVPTPIWTVADLQVRGDAGECLAWVGGACSVTLGEYNAAAVQFRMPASMPLDSARESVLKRYLLEKQVAAKGETLGLGRSADSILNAEKLMRSNRRWIKSSRAFGMPVQDLRTLQMLYGQHFGELFAAREEATLEVLGASDSAYVDSLHRVLSAWQKLRKAGKSPGKDTAKEPVLPWATFREKDLPRELAAVADSFHVGQVSAPFRTRTGFFLVRLSKLESRKEISFDDAVSRLIFLATRSKFLDMDSILEAKARKHYQANKADFALPDTLALISWLMPRETRRDAGGAVSTPDAKTDTARFRPLALMSLELPRDLRKRLQSLAKADTQKTFFGPLPDRFGRWYFKVRSRKVARDTLPYRLVRKEILEKISQPLPEAETGLASEKSLDDVLVILGTATAVRRKEHAMRDMPGAPGSDGATHSQEMDEAATTQAIDLRIKRMKEMEDKAKRENLETLRKAKLNTSRLSAGNPG